MKMRKKSFSMGVLILSMACILSFALFVILTGIAAWTIGKQETQQMGQRWSAEGDASQVSCFFSVNTHLTPDSIEEFEHNLDSALEEASITVASPHANVRLWADAYSANGKISVKSNITEVTVDAIGIGGDFFLFHPLELLSGSYFSGNDIMKDYCVLDREAAWKLFGSNDIAGQVVYIGGVAHIVTGVVEREEGDWYEEAGLDSSLIYVSYDTLSKYGTNHGINHFEIVMPNPVKGYALNYIKEAIGVAESELEIVENSTRYDILNRIKHIGKLSVRAMNGKAIIYPYWENVARAYEDRLAVLMLFQIICLVFPVVVLLITLRILWKRKTWTVKGTIIKTKDKLELKLAQNRTKRKEKKKSKELDI